MKIRNFLLEDFFCKYEFTAPYLLTQSDCESMTQRELLALEPGSEEGFLDHWLGYTETPGDPALREEIAQCYDGLDAGNILVLHGAQEGLFAYMNAMLDAGDHAIVMFPNYQSAFEICNSIPGCSWSKWEIHDNGTGWTIDFDELERLITPKTKLIAVNSPNNPTGLTFSDAETEKLCDICRAHGIYLLSDEVYLGLEADGVEHKSACVFYEKATSLNVLSKSFGLPGLRVGWIATKDAETRNKVQQFKNYLSLCDSAPSEYLARIAVRHRDALRARCRDIIRENTKVAREFFARHRDVFDERPVTAGPIAFHRLKADVPVSVFCREAVEKQGVLLAPAELYEVDGPYFRMGYGRKNMPECLAQFETFLTNNGYSK